MRFLSVNLNYSIYNREVQFSGLKHNSYYRLVQFTEPKLCPQTKSN